MVETHWPSHAPCSQKLLVVCLEKEIHWNRIVMKIDLNTNPPIPKKKIPQNNWNVSIQKTKHLQLCENLTTCDPW